MPSRKNQPSKYREKINEIAEENEYYALVDASQNRARSLTVGTTTGGLIEVQMRSDRASLYYILKPVEATEIIEQLAAAAGLEVAKRPKQDFTAWRSWDLNAPDEGEWLGSAPWNLNERGKRQLKKAERERMGYLPPSKEKPKLQASTKRKKKVEEETEE